MNKELDKIHKKQRAALLQICNGIASDFSFKKVKTWRDVYRRKGESDEEILARKEENIDQAVTFPALKAYIEILKKQQEERFKREIEQASKPPVVEEKAPEPELLNAQTLSSTDESGIKNSNRYGVPLFPPNFKAFLFWFQLKALKEMLDKILGFDVSMCKDLDELKAEFEKRGRKGNMRGIMLLASTGTGKTFMAAALVYVLNHIGFTTDKTFGPVEYLYVTRASIVTQTKRVFESLFDLSPAKGIEVLNVEQLRSRAGQLWVTEKVTVVNGEEQVYWEWRKGMQPVVLLLDECQSFKNEGSTQSQIIQGYAEIPTKETYTVFISATPFTRVSEAKAFVINAHFDDPQFII